ncbi:MAG TPA: gliding motility-associated C-terminal domain-containing protein [Bacteroidales bacterium]|nr:gliding motility-associated C-terminal domain-containing protein [Bacteroidales bacterium]HQK67047.1 gliding motility-associated C-terminal domain-containing protein [Bacteroidales bacterium]
MMKYRFTILLAIVLWSSGAFAQPPEQVYQGTVIATGFRQSIPPASAGPFEIGFDFTFFGNTYSQFYVSANGLVLFDAPTDAYNTEATIPTAAIPNNYIAPFWDNLSILDVGNVMYSTVGASGSKKCIIQFKKMGFDPVPTPFGTFMVILYETTNVIQIQYRLILDPFSPKPHGESATIGLENADGSAGTLYAFHDPNAIFSHDAISFTPASPTTYTINSDAIYDGIFLTTDITLPDPGTVDLISPAEDAEVGADVTFTWAAATYATSYYFVMDDNPDLSSAKYTDVGLNLSYDTTGLILDKTYYWTVFSYNATSFTWTEISRFSTVAAPPLAVVPQTFWTEQGQDKTIKLNYTGGDASPKTAVITSLPVQGQLYQYDGGARGALINSVPANVTDAGMNVIYAASGTAGNGAGNFKFKVTDAGGESPEATITVNVSPPGIPAVLYTAKSSDFIEIQFDRQMTDPAGKQGQFEIKVNDIPVTISAAALKSGDPYTIVLSLASSLTGSETVKVSYTQGDVTSAVGGYLLAFTDEPVTYIAQTITWTQSLDRIYNETPFRLTATASSALGLTYTSSNTAVSTVAGSNLNFHSLGTSEITAKQAGNATYAPAKYSKTLTVSKGNQTITFGPLEDKTFGDPPFTLTATATSGLTVTFTISNTAVATVSGNTVTITGGGTATITASQEGNAWWNPATPVEQILTVNKVDQTITFNALPAKVFDDADFSPGATSSSGLTVTYASDNENVATIVNNMIHITGAGSAVITASQAGNDTYNPAEDVTQTLTVGKADQTITFTNYPDEILLGTTYNLTAVASSGLAVLFESNNTTIATVAGNLLTAVKKGSVQIRAYNAGNENYEPAEALVTVEVTSTHRDIMNLFTPNGDGINDYWELPEMDAWGRCDVRIFNRWGKLVFAQDDYDNLWDGTSNDNPLPEGPYYYVIETQNSGTIKGTVNILR